MNITLNDNQKQFFRTLPQADVIIDSGTWRSGKSFELSLFVLLRMLKYPGITEFIGRKTLTSVKETTRVTFKLLLEEALPPNRYKCIESGSLRIRLYNGSQVVFGDLNADTMNKWLSSEFSDVCIDEGQEVAEICFEKLGSRQTQRIIEALSGGTKRNKFLIAMNPPESATLHWTHRKFRDPETKIPNAIMIYSHIESNLHNLPNGYLESVTSKIDHRTAEIYLRGNWVPLLSRLVFPDYFFPRDARGTFTEGGNIRWHTPQPGLENYISMDFGWTHPMVIACWQYDRSQGTIYRCYEVVESHVRPETYSALLSGSEAIINGKRYLLPFDLHTSSLIMGLEVTQKRQEADGKSHLEIMRRSLRERGIVDPKLHVVQTTITKGVMAVRRRILTATGERKIFIDSRYCQRFIRDAEMYHYRCDESGNIVSEEPEKDNISDHTQDETRYLMAHLDGYSAGGEWRM